MVPFKFDKQNQEEIICQTARNYVNFWQVTN